MDKGCGIVTIFHGGIFRGGGPHPVEYVNGRQARYYVDGDDYSEFKLLKSLNLLGYDKAYIRGIYYKSANVPLDNMYVYRDEWDVWNLAEIITNDGGVQIYVDHAPNNSEVVPEIGWVEGEDVNEIDEPINCSEEAGGVPLVCASESDDIPSAYGDSDDEVDKETQFQEEREYYSNCRSSKSTAVGSSSRKNVKKTYANRKTFSVKHVPTHRSNKKAKAVLIDGRGNGEGNEAGGGNEAGEGNEAGGGNEAGEGNEGGGRGFYEEDDPGWREERYRDYPDFGANLPGDSDEDEAAKERSKKRKERNLASSRRYKTLHESDVEDVMDWRPQRVADDDYGPSGHSNRRGHDDVNIPPLLFRDSDDSSSDDVFDRLPRRRVVTDPREGREDNIWYNPEWEDPYFQVGMKFTGPNQFKSAIKKYAIKKGAGITTKKNDSKRQRYICQGWCPWEILASYSKADNSFKVKTYTWQHDCLSEYNIKKASTDYLAEIFKDRVRAEPFYKVRQIMVDALRELKLDVKFSKCYRIKNVILDELEGNFKDEYAVVQGYADYLISVNPNNTVKVVSDRKTSAPGSPAVFSRLYICLSVLKEGWKNSCRPFIGVDGTWLKGPCKGVLLVACGKDGNDQMFPIAWAAVDGESYDSWRWFFQLLAADLELGDGEGITIMSDRHKGIMAARDSVFPKAVQRHCARHIHANWSTKHGGDELRDLFWACSYAYNEQQWKRAMANLKKYSVQAHDDLLAIDKRIWARAFFNDNSGCEDVTNNVSESFNSCIQTYRVLPVISMMEAISNKMMERRAVMYHSIMNWRGDFSPNSLSRLGRRQDDAHETSFIWDGHHKYRVQDKKYGYQHVVNMKKRTCSCGYWQLNGIPCQHVLRCATKKELNAYSFMSKYYSKEVCLQAYEHPIEVTRGPEMWCTYRGERLEPPVFRRRPGRPSKNRRKSKGEVRKVPGQKAAWLSRNGRAMHCTNCGEEGHNTRTCKKPRPTKDNANVGEGATPTTNVRRQSTVGSTSTQKARRKAAGGSISRSNKEKNARRKERAAEKAAANVAETARQNAAQTDHQTAAQTDHQTAAETIPPNVEENTG